MTSPSIIHPNWRRYVAVGDSFTEGLQDELPDGSMRGWADRLAQALADRAGEPVEYANLAVRGRLLGRIIDEQLEPALALSPDLVSIVGGGNDLLRPGSDPDALAARLEAAVVRLRAAGTDVLLGLGSDTSGFGMMSLLRGRVAIYNANLTSIAQRHGAHLLNLWGMRSVHDLRMWHPDRLHFNPDGHQRVAQAALVALGLPPDRLDWDDPLPPAAPSSVPDGLRTNLAWTRDYLVPWIGRRLHHTSSGDGRTGKQVTYRRVSPTTSSDQVS
jgi:lysophospholipase L1-like esterase